MQTSKTSAGSAALMTGSGLANQFGAGIAALAFPVLGPFGVVAVRQWVAGVVLLAVGRPALRSFTRAQWWPILALAAVFATMNLSLYTAIDRIGLGLAVTLEFLGPLAVALCATRRLLDGACAAAVGVAVLVLTRPQPSTDYVGIGLGLLAAACWAAYILLNRTVGQRVPGAQGSGAAAGVSALAYAAVGIPVLIHSAPSPTVLAYAAAAGVLSSAVPFLADMLALRSVSARSFGVFMSVNPVLAALVGMVLLDETLGLPEWLAIAAITAANAVSLTVSERSPEAVRRPRRTPCRAAHPVVSGGGPAAGAVID